MSDDLRAPLLPLLAALDGLRDDFREDNRHLRDEVRRDIARVEDRVMNMMQAFAKAHAAEHDEDRIVLERDLVDLKAWKHAGEITLAKKEGALGVLRFGLELLTRHGKVIVAVLLPAILGLLALTGNVSFSVGIR